MSFIRKIGEHEIQIPQINAKKDLNTFILETGTSPFADINEKCHTILDRAIFEDGYVDKDGNAIFSMQNKKDKWGENYKDNSIKQEGLDGSEREIIIPGMIIGGMGTEVSSISLIEAGAKIGVGGLISSVGIGGTYEEPSVYVEGEEFIKNNAIVEKSFYDLFEIQLGLSKDFIHKEFFECDDGFDDPYFKLSGNKHARMFRMKELIAIYNTVKAGKDKGITFGMNSMYKTSTILAAMKVATMAGIDYISISAGFPKPHDPKNMLWEFIKKLNEQKGREGMEKVNFIPALGLTLSVSLSGDETKFYDYYVIEDGNYAGGHLGVTEGMLHKAKTDKYNVLKRTREFLNIARPGEHVPIYVAGGLEDQKDIKKAFQEGADGFQIGTSASISQEAMRGIGEEFKLNNIGYNHWGAKNSNDFLTQAKIEEGESKIRKLTSSRQKELLGILDIKPIEKITIDRVNKYFHQQIFPDFIDKSEIIELNEQEQMLLDEIQEHIVNYAISKMLNKRKLNDIDALKSLYKDEETYIIAIGNEVRKLLRNYGNALKFSKEFDTFYIENPGKLPTHLVFDSVVGFDGRKRFLDDSDQLLHDSESIECIQCLTSCKLMKRGDVKEADGSNFCIPLALDKRDRIAKDLFNALYQVNVNFSGRTTVPYGDIRPLSHIVAALMGYYIE